MNELTISLPVRSAPEGALEATEITSNCPVMLSEIASPSDPPGEPQSYEVEVIADGSGQWCCNQVRLATIAEAEEYGGDLAWRWLSVRTHRVAPSTEPVTHRFQNGKLERLPEVNPPRDEHRES